METHWTFNACQSKFYKTVFQCLFQRNYSHKYQNCVFYVETRHLIVWLRFNGFACWIHVKNSTTFLYFCQIYLPILRYVLCLDSEPALNTGTVSEMAILKHTFEKWEKYKILPIILHFHKLGYHCLNQSLLKTYPINKTI